MVTLSDLKGFEVAAADVSVWVFKTSPNTDGIPKFTGRWVGITEDLEAELRSAVRMNLDQVTETLEYDILAQNNEGSALTITADETYAGIIAAKIANETPASKVQSLRHLENSKFCVVKFVRSGKMLLAVRKTDASWSTRKNKGFIRMVYSDEELDVDIEPAFVMRPDFDFYLLEDTIFIKSKSHFEAVLAYKAGHESAFEELKADASFAGIFADLVPLTEYVGSNKIHLRRVMAIKQKGYYKDAGFMTRLRAEHKSMNLAIEFDEVGRIIPTLESSRDIFQALLDHRLDSRLTSLMYDVPSTETVK